MEQPSAVFSYAQHGFIQSKVYIFRVRKGATQWATQALPSFNFLDRHIQSIFFYLGDQCFCCNFNFLAGDLIECFKAIYKERFFTNQISYQAIDIL